MKKVSQQTLDAIRQRCDIVEVVQASVPLKRAGSAFKACCPFHKEKTPSFQVNPARQIYHCFGCGAGGDVFRFVMEYEKVDFMTAVRMLARRASIELEMSEDERRDTSNKDLLFKLHEDIATLYQQALLKAPSAGPARDYLASRKLDGEPAKRFRIGYAPDALDTLTRWATSRKVPIALLETAGLVMRSERGTYDRFRHRVMFPIGDEQGRVIGFSGRVLRAEDSPAKYMNSPETPLFHKSRVLYALDKARRAIVDSRRAVLCEGQIDTLRCHLAGIENAVAAQGTAVTEDHARVLKRYADEVVVMLDADAAGQNAALRSAEALMAAGLSLRLASLPAGEDPDSVILKSGPQPVLDAIERAVPAVAFLVGLYDQRGELKTDAGRLRTLGAVLDLVLKVPGEAAQEEHLRQAALPLGVSVEALRRDLRALARRRARPSTAVDATPGAAVGPAPLPPDERALVVAALQFPQHHGLIRDFLPPSMLDHPALRRMLELVLKNAGAGGWSLTSEAGDDPAFGRLAAELESTVQQISGDEASSERAVQDIILRVWRSALMRRRRELMSASSRASEAGRAELSARSHGLTMQIKTLERGWDVALPILELGAPE